MLIYRYQDSLDRYKIVAGQVLLTAGDLENPTHRSNAQRAMERLLGLRILPIVNENDTVATHEIRFGDNDRLAALVSELIGADLLVLLSDVDALYTRPPSEPGARPIAHVPFDDDLVGRRARRHRRGGCRHRGSGHEDRGGEARGRGREPPCCSPRPATSPRPSPARSPAPGSTPRRSDASVAACAARGRRLTGGAIDRCASAPARGHLACGDGTSGIAISGASATTRTRPGNPTTPMSAPTAGATIAAPRNCPVFCAPSARPDQCGSGELGDRGEREPVVGDTDAAREHVADGGGDAPVAGRPRRR